MNAFNFSPRTQAGHFRNGLALACLTTALLVPVAATASPATATTSPTENKVIVTGTVPDEGSKVAIINRLRTVYGSEQVVDRLNVGKVAAPPGWLQQVERMLTPSLKSIHKGQLNIDGANFTMRGQVADEATKSRLGAESMAGLKPTYRLTNNLHVGASEQKVLDDTLADRIIEFESGSAVLTAEGMKILDEMAGAIQKVGAQQLEIIGHTDSSGNRGNNIALSERRAQAVKEYLMNKGIAENAMKTKGMGPDQPIASNDTADGRKRNRRIEFRL